MQGAVPEEGAPVAQMDVLIPAGALVGAALGVIIPVVPLDAVLAALFVLFGRAVRVERLHSLQLT